MKKCNVCGATYEDGTSFCTQCGSALDGGAGFTNVAEPVMAETEAVEPPAADMDDSVGATTILSQTNLFSGSDNVGFTSVESNDAGFTSVESNDAGFTSVGGNNDNGFMSGNSANAEMSGAASGKPVKGKKAGKGAGIAGLVIGIIMALSVCGNIALSMVPVAGIITSALALILVIVALVLSINCIRKKEAKGFGIVGLVINLFALIFNGVTLIIAILVTCGVMTPTTDNNNTYDDIFETDDPYEDWLDYDTESEYDFDDEDWDQVLQDMSDLEVEDTSSNIVADENGDTDAIEIDGRTMYIPCHAFSLDLTCAGPDEGFEATIESEGVEPGTYRLVYVNESTTGASFYVYLENTDGETIYNMDDLSVTGFYVDDTCDINYVNLYGIGLGDSRDHVVSLLGEDYTTEEGTDFYDFGAYYYGITYDGDVVTAVEYTYY